MTTPRTPMRSRIPIQATRQTFPCSHKRARPNDQQQQHRRRIIHIVGETSSQDAFRSEPWVYAQQELHDRDDLRRPDAMVRRALIRRHAGVLTEIGTQNSTGPKVCHRQAIHDSASCSQSQSPRFRLIFAVESYEIHVPDRVLHSLTRYFKSWWALAASLCCIVSTVREH